MSTELTDLNDLPAAPRAITAKARRRSWAEASVRTWMILTLVICGVTAYLYSARITAGMKDRTIIANGLPIRATVIAIDGVAAPGSTALRRNRPTVIIRYLDSNAQEITSEQQLGALVDGAVTVGRELEIRVDPANPAKWSDRTEPQPWSAELSVPLLITPFCFICILILFIRRKGVLRVWQTGEPAVAQIVEVRQSPIAPRQQQVSYALAEGGQVCKMLFPLSEGPLSVGDEVIVVAPPNDPARAVAAELYI